MKFHYSGILSTAQDTGEETLIFRPEVPLVVHGPRGAMKWHALVDTGADNTVLPSSLAETLGIQTTPCRGPNAVAFGGQQISMSFAEVELELPFDDGSLRWPAHVFFCEPNEESQETPILGHQGFLDFFTATFIGEECALELTPNADLPRD